MNAGNKSKRVKIAESEQLDLVPSTNQSLIISETSAANSSKLQGPTVALTGHSGPVFSISFSPDGHNLASASLDESICKFLIFYTYIYEHSLFIKFNNPLSI